uniref:AN1-type zinc finger protein 1-like n=1 Tax=Saccoglossus kowalevskii TaxID=10224 RepID=A0ABM0MYP7_SACKO|nr:PREDICTED: AN1-type zinc finger protein 1-like [Saccoglossus kowalevskii]
MSSLYSAIFQMKNQNSKDQNLTNAVLNIANAKELLPIICEHCQMQVCLSHRHQVDHRCSKYEAPTEKMTKTSEHVRQIIDSKKDKSPLKKGPSGVKSKKTAAKVALMKMKMHAVGDKGLPQNERLYFEIFLPLGHSVRSQSMFFSKVWTIGKTIDKIAELAKLKNNNNIVTAQKLRIFDENGCIILPLEQSLDRLIESEVFHSGGSVIIEYVDDSCAKLENIESYSSR